MTPEGEIQAHLKKGVIASGGTFRKVRWEGRRGAPDTLIYWDGPSFAWVEVKTMNGVVSKLQRREHDRMRDAGFLVFVIRSKAEAAVVIERLRQPSRCV